ncbi:MAG: sulfotransferase family 2 domain-containing protein [Pseudomonadota bacterium]
MLFTDQGPMFFIHVPKTGGTSMEDYLRRRFGPLALNDINKREKVPGTGLIAAINHLSAIDLKELIPQQSLLTFAIVRNPLNRLLSEYQWQRQASFMSRFSFSTWLRIVTKAYAYDARVYGNHIRPQDQMVPEGVETFQLEDGFEAIIARIDEVTRSTHPDLGVGQFKRRTAPREEITVYRQDVALVQSIYSTDYARFGYPLEDQGSYPADPLSALRAGLAMPLARALIAKQRQDWLR